jgi:hypothetical protein
VLPLPIGRDASWITVLRVRSPKTSHHDHVYSGSLGSISGSPPEDFGGDVIHRAYHFRDFKVVRHRRWQGVTQWCIFG